MLSDSWELLACFMLHMAGSIWRKDRTALIIHQNHDGEKERIEKSKSSDKQGSLLSPDAGFAQTGDDRQLSHPWKERVLLTAQGATRVKFLQPEVGVKVPHLENIACSHMLFPLPASASAWHSLSTVVVTILEPPALEHVHWDFLTWNFSYCGTHRSNSTGGEMLHVGLFIRQDHKDVIKGGRVTYDTADLWTPHRRWSPSNRN